MAVEVVSDCCSSDSWEEEGDLVIKKGVSRNKLVSTPRQKLTADEKHAHLMHSVEYAFGSKEGAEEVLTWPLQDLSVVVHEVPGPVFSWPETLAFQAVGLRCAKRVPFL